MGAKSATNGTGQKAENIRGVAEKSVGDNGGTAVPRRKRGKKPGYTYFKTPAEARHFLAKKLNEMLVGDTNDPRYVRQFERYKCGLEAYDAALKADPRTDMPIPERPMPPRLEPMRFNALTGGIRTWIELKDSELEALLKEVQETNQKLLEIIESKERQQGGGSA